jgi:hypothetical protein
LVVVEEEGVEVLEVAERPAGDGLDLVEPEISGKEKKSFLIF